jgi:hypothetical protein
MHWLRARFRLIVSSWKSRREHSISKQPQTENEGKPANQQGNGAPITRAIEDVRDTIIQAYDRNQQEQNAENRKNRTIAKWAVAGAWIYAGIAAFQFCEMRAANDLIQKQLEATDRPWIKVVGAVPNHPLIFHGAGSISAHGDDFVNLGIKVIIQNVGRSVALNVIIRSDVIFVSMIQGADKNPFTYPVKMQKALCSKEPAAGLPINLFPGDDNRDQTGDDHDVPISGNSFTIPDDPSVARMKPMFIGCVDYTIGVSGKIHQSGFIYELQERENTRMLIVDNDVAISDLAMEPFAFGGFFAN